MARKIRRKRALGAIRRKTKLNVPKVCAAVRKDIMGARDALSVMGAEHMAMDYINRASSRIQYLDNHDKACNDSTMSAYKRLIRRVE
jgi:hypothetical protein